VDEGGGAEWSEVISDDFYEKEKVKVRLSESDHILDVAHKAICGEEGMRRTSELITFMFHQRGG
jgi:hypothetical protein